VRFDWDDPTTHSPALEDVDRIYLVAQVMRMDFADQVADVQTRIAIERRGDEEGPGC
jgi:hypothetical protein